MQWPGTEQLDGWWLPGMCFEEECDESHISCPPDSHDVSLTTTTTVTTDTKLSMINPEAKVAGDVNHFYAYACWLDPNSDGFWVPTYRRGLGDKPWFVVFYIPNSSITKLTAGGGKPVVDAGFSRRLLPVLPEARAERCPCPGS